MKEIWKPVKGYESLYEVSNLGRIKSLKNNQGNYREKILKFKNHRDGYLSICLYKNKKKKSYSVHRLVAQAFIPNPKNLPEVNHKNGIKIDNRVLKLEWLSNSDNVKHAFKIGLKSFKGEKNNSARLIERQVRRIKFIAKYYKVEKGYWRKLAKSLNIHFGTISAIICNRNWKNIEI